MTDLILVVLAGIGILLILEAVIRAREKSRGKRRW